MPSVAEGEPLTSRAPRATPARRARQRAADEVKKWEFTAVLGGAANNFFDRETERRRARARSRRSPTSSCPRRRPSPRTAARRSRSTQCSSTQTPSRAACAGSKVDAVTAARSASVESLGRLSNKIAMAPGALAKVRALQAAHHQGRARGGARAQASSSTRAAPAAARRRRRAGSRRAGAAARGGARPGRGPRAADQSARRGARRAARARRRPVQLWERRAHAARGRARRLVHRLGWLNTWSPLRPTAR